MIIWRLVRTVRNCFFLNIFKLLPFVIFSTILLTMISPLRTSRQHYVYRTFPAVSITIQIFIDQFGFVNDSSRHLFDPIRYLDGLGKTYIHICTYKINMIVYFTLTSTDTYQKTRKGLYYFRMALSVSFTIDICVGSKYSWCICTAAGAQRSTRFRPRSTTIALYLRVSLCVVRLFSACRTSRSAQKSEKIPCRNRTRIRAAAYRRKRQRGTSRVHRELITRRQSGERVVNAKHFKTYATVDKYRYNPYLGCARKSNYTIFLFWFLFFRSATALVFGTECCFSGNTSQS